MVQTSPVLCEPNFGSFFQTEVLPTYPVHFHTQLLKPLETRDEHPGCNAAHAAALALPLRSFHAWLNAAPGSAFPTTSLCKQLPRKNHLIIIFAPSSRRCCWSQGSLQPQKSKQGPQAARMWHRAGCTHPSPSLRPQIRVRLGPASIGSISALLHETW